MHSATDQHSNITRSEQLQTQPLDVLVIGGGIVGAGVARDAAMRGLRTGLVEQHDFASGTSSRSSRLLHGGMRYLAQGRVGLVWEASKEKTVLRRIAPHLAEPLEFIFPTRQANGWPRWKLGLGVKLYDLLCGVGKGGGSGSMGVAETLRRVPGLNGEQLTGAVRYHDALTNDSRLVLDTINSAVQHGAVACNYVKLLDATREGDRWRCELEDRRNPALLVVQARSVVNATGPWSDKLPNSETSLRLTKGVHLVIDRARLPMDDAVVLAEGSRILFVIPWGERVILGTTDTDYRGQLDNPPCDPEDVSYILQVVNDAFPAAKLTPQDLVSTWSGLRPLVADKNGNPSDISRRHKIAMSHAGWWDVTGGKLTTYRLMGEETVDAIVRFLGAKAAPCRTATTPLVERGPRGELGDATSCSGILPPPVSAAAVSRYCRLEAARHLDDVMIRRSSWRHYYRNHLELAGNVSRWMASELGWTDAETELELKRYRGLTAHSPIVGTTAPAPDVQLR
ncbi:glycerol-3-phosphate dehydrogenase/oxidase [Lacipirellula limnantheis]|uniref:Glycerol-3-phosphate dehydrogenase n=1 Tax=Lacipirellula limnantheis TaxID=2528024 RepID=A0A517TRL3_9BACT|nr:glycerol-3-phosphate dehydrogenase/oxidase [Lacipirellula limnantheis]QDT71022.1 Aerobic glycerol-3-phosphate dehydrogenase [Lacipirellula limnantheis]